MVQTTLTVSDVKTGYKGFFIQDINFALGSGDILALTGRSGAGKSTIIKTLLGILKPVQGSIAVRRAGESVDLNAVVGYSSQDHALFSYLTIKENIELFAKLQEQDPHETQKRMHDLLTRFDLVGSKDKRVGALSGGMRKRADLAVALIHNPDIIILDEPFSGLDVSIQQFIWDLIEDLSTEGRIVIITSHRIDALEEHTDLFALVHDKRFYSPKQITEGRSATEFSSTAQYLAALFADRRHL